MKIKLNNKKIFIYIILLTIIILLLPLLVRLLFFNGIIPGEEHYYDIRISEYISNNKKIPSIDPLTKENYILVPYHILLSLFPIESSILASIILGALSIILFYQILNKLRINYLEKILTLIILIISPSFIFLFSLSNQYFLSIFLILLGFYLFTQKKRIYFILSIPIFALTSIFNLPISLLSLSLILIYSINNKLKIKNFYIISIITIPLTIIYHTYIYNSYGFPQYNPFEKLNIFQQLFSDLGGVTGISIFSALLAILGMYLFWQKRKQIIAYMLFSIFIIISLYSNYLIPHLSFIIAIFAAYGFSKIISMKWHLKIIKNLTIIILFLGLLFSSISYIQRITTQNPNQEIIDSLTWLRTNSNKDSIVFSYPENTHFINQIAKRDTFIHKPFEYAKDLQNKTNATHEIFYSRTLEKTKLQLTKNNITHIYITPEMKSKVWSSEDQGLLFLFRNKETFKKIYQKNNIEIWEIK